MGGIGGRENMEDTLVSRGGLSESEPSIEAMGILLPVLCDAGAEEGGSRGVKGDCAEGWAAGL